MLVLVTGASGFVGSALVPRMRRDGHTVRALGRDERRVRDALESNREREREDPHAGPLHVLRGDALSGEGLTAALDGVEVAYYLIHSMEHAAAGALPFEERERIAAHNFAAAAARAGVRRIVYLGGLLPRWDSSHSHIDPRAHPRAHADDAAGAAGVAGASRHLASREQVERILLAGVEDSLALRASIVIGARSRSFRLLVRLVERMPLLALPAWHTFRTQPIDARDVIAMLAACATAQPPKRSLEVGGPDVLTYGEMLTRIADILLIGRPALPIGVSMTPIAARVAAAIAGEDPELVLPLMEGLKGDLLPADDHAAELLGVRLHGYDSAVGHALAEWERTERLAAR